MDPKFVFLTNLALIVLSQVSGLGLRKKCACGLTSGGLDMCGCEDVVVRPPRPHKPPTLSVKETVGSKVKLGPTAEPYTDEEANYVHTAPVQTYSSSPYQKLESSYNFDSIEALYPYPAVYSSSGGPAKTLDFNTYGDSEHVSDYAGQRDGYYRSVAPADLVSASLAHELARRAGTTIKEEGLRFDPRIIPNFGTVVKAHKDVPDDRLFSFDKQIVEPRYPLVRHGIWSQEEEEEALLAAQKEAAYAEESNYRGPANYLSYADLGYVPEIPRRQHQLAAGPSAAFEDQIIPYEDEYSRPAPKPCTRGGHVIVSSRDADSYSDEQRYSSDERGEENYFIGRHKPCNNFVSKLKPSRGSVKYTEIFG